MLLYNNEQIMESFRIYSTLSANGAGECDDMRSYMADDKVRALVDQFSRQVDCTVFTSGEKIYMVPIAKSSPFHISNESLKREYFLSRWENSDLYTMYLSVIVLFGCFYDSYQTIEPTRDFINMAEWMDMLSERIESLEEHGEERLAEMDKELECNWSSIVKKWTDMDEIKETVKTQKGQTISKMSFLNSVRRFLEKQDLVKDIGNDEIELTEKSKVIVQRYYMEYDYNRGILNFIYEIEKKRGEI